MSKLNTNFEKYTKGFKSIYKKSLKKEPTMGDYVFNGWLNIKDRTDIDFKAVGKLHAENLVKNIQNKEE